MKNNSVLFKVWVSLLLTILVVIATLILIETIGTNKKGQFELEMIFYVLGVLLYQGSMYLLKQM